MINNEKGLTLVELLATLTLLSLVTGIIWTTVSISTQFNVSETTNLRIQQEANYILTELQSIHRSCSDYRLTVTEKKVSVNGCLEINGIDNIEKIISTGYRYVAIVDKQPPALPSKDMVKGEDNDFQDIIELKIKPASKNLVFTYFAVEDLNNNKRYVNIPTTISRYKVGN